jgi:hypothetical protein
VVKQTNVNFFEGMNNADCYISEILTTLAKWCAGQVGATDRELMVHSGNARPHTAKRVNEFLANNGMTRAPHPPYLPDLAPCNFFRFSYIKTQLMGRSLYDSDQLLMGIKEVFSQHKIGNFVLIKDMLMLNTIMGIV